MRPRANEGVEHASRRRRRNRRRGRPLVGPVEREKPKNNNYHTDQSGLHKCE